MAADPLIDEGLVEARRCANKLLAEEGELIDKLIIAFAHGAVWGSRQIEAAVHGAQATKKAISK